MSRSHPKLTTALLLLSLFTPVERAREIEGDLIEEEWHRGSFYYSFQVLMTSMALMGRAVGKEIPALALLGFGGYQLAIVFDFHLIAPIREFLWLWLEDGSLLVKCATFLIWFLSTFLYGLLLALILRDHGTGASLSTAIFLLIRLAFFEAYASTPWPIAMLQALAYVVLPLLLGAFFVHYIHLRRLLSHTALTSG